MKVLRTRVQFPTSPPSAGMHWLRRGKIVKQTTGQATDLISAKLVNANDDIYNEDLPLAA